jgi:predicted TIM-barrel fold metal-dependent hydrolase
MGGLKEVSRVYNNHIASVMKKYPGRFIGAAILPADDRVEMMREYSRVTTDLGFGALSLPTSFEGIYLDDERFISLYERAESGGIPIFIHPQTINPIGYERVKDPLLTPVIEFVFDTTVCIGKLITGGILKRFPDMKFIFAHFGGVTPFIKERFDSIYRMLRGRGIVKDLSALPTEYLRQIYVDTSGVTSKHALMCTKEMVGVDHILWGSDYPGNPDIPASVGAIEELDITDEEKAKILGGNAAEVLPGSVS